MIDVVLGVSLFGLGFSQIVHFSVAVSGFFREHSVHVHSFASVGTALEVVGGSGRMKVNASMARFSAAARTASEGEEGNEGRVKVKNGKAALSIVRALSLADR